MNNDPRNRVPRLYGQPQQEWHKKQINFSTIVQRGPELVLLLG
jgi:hypothetical protein